MHGGFNHLHARKRISKHLSAYPHPTFWKRILDYVMYVVAIISPAALLPQVIHLYKAKDAAGLSWESFSMFVVINTLWLVYALAHRELPLAIASVFFAALDIALVYGIFIYG